MNLSHIQENIDKFNRIVKGNKDKYPALSRAATTLAAPTAPILGRDYEISDLRLNLRNPEKANVILLGEPGSGKSAIAQGFAFHEDSSQYLVLSIDVERLADDISADKDAAMANGLLDLVKEVENYSHDNNVIIVLFIDEFHRITMISPSAVESLKPILEQSARYGFRVIAATTFEEYNEWVAPNRALDQRLLRMDLPELSRDAVISILKSRAIQYGVDDFAEEGIYGEIYDVASHILISNSQPRSSIDILLNMVGNITKVEYMNNGELVREYATPDELNIKSKYSLSRPMLNRVIQRSYGIDIDNRVNINEVREALTRSIYNQDDAINAFMSRLEMSLAGFNDPTRPKISILSTGSTGTGKALKDSELIPAPVESGYIQNGSLRIGDVIYDKYGKYTNVVGVFHKGMRTVYRVKLSDGRCIDAASDHLWSVKDTRTNEWSVVSTLDILGFDLMSRNNRNKYNYILPDNSGVIREPREYEISPYDYGYALGLEAKEKDGRELSIDEGYKFGSISQRMDLVKGLLDANGGIIGDTFDIVFMSLSRKLMDDFQEVLWSLGHMSKVTQGHHSNSELYQLVLMVPNIDKHTFFNSGQKRIIANMARHSDDLYDFSIGIVSVEKLDVKEPMTCIMVDNDEHLYLAGVGHIVTHNTEIAKVISQSLKIPLKRFDMSRYPNPEDAVQFADELANAAWSAPNSYILIDEAEKSTRECMNILLQVLDDARLTSANNSNRVISFTGNIINLTTNLGSEVYQHSQRYSGGEVSDESLIYKTLAESDEFETAVLGRVDVIVPFKPLPVKALALIAKRELVYNISIAETHKRPIFVSPDILPYIIRDRMSTDTESGGARDAKRKIKNVVIQQVASYMAKNRPECPLIVRLDKMPRFRDKLVGDPLTAGVVVEECYPMEQIDKVLLGLSSKLNVKLSNEGLFIPVTYDLKEMYKQIIELARHGSRSFKTTVDVTDVIIIDGDASIDIAGSAKSIGGVLP